MVVLAMISFAMPELTGRKLYAGWVPEWAFWTSNIGMVGMTGAFAVAGITQVYLERKMGLDFLAVQEAISVHFIGLILAACLFTVGIGLYIWNFINTGSRRMRRSSPAVRHERGCSGAARRAVLPAARRGMCAV